MVATVITAHFVCTLHNVWCSLREAEMAIVFDFINCLPAD